MSGTVNPESTQPNIPLFVPTTTPSPRASETTTGRQLRVPAPQAASWLIGMEQLSLAGALPETLTTFRNRLEDACWLARWQREAVSLEACPAELGELLCCLLQLIESDKLACINSQPLEDLARTLAALGPHQS